MKKNLLFLFALLVWCSSEAKSPTLNFISSRGAKREISLKELKAELKEKELQVQSSPAYGGRAKKFIGFDFVELLQKLDPTTDLAQPFSVKVTTLDGWKAPLYDSKTLLKGKALLAIREAKETITDPASDDGLWTIAVDGKKRFYPGPFYLVWNDEGKNPDIMPLQVASIEIIRR